MSELTDLEEIESNVGSDLIGQRLYARILTLSPLKLFNNSNYFANTAINNAYHNQAMNQQVSNAYSQMQNSGIGGYIIG